MLGGAEYRFFFLGGGFKHFCNFHPENLGERSNLTFICFRWVVQPPSSFGWFL